uniref:Uncharacterized protein n=1 Tax=Ananas comosus var. bracteatus TaxID=296719 RepID=A0A6V7NEZ8_ANACO|nr:unnamed protein product [Ananas comosus var. bracteatus]
MPSPPCPPTSTALATTSALTTPRLPRLLRCFHLAKLAAPLGLRRPALRVPPRRRSRRHPRLSHGPLLQPRPRQRRQRRRDLYARPCRDGPRRCRARLSGTPPSPTAPVQAHGQLQDRRHGLEAQDRPRDGLVQTYKWYIENVAADHHSQTKFILLNFRG